MTIEWITCGDCGHQRAGGDHCYTCDRRDASDRYRRQREITREAQRTQWRNRLAAQERIRAVKYGHCDEFLAAIPVGADLLLRGAR